MALVRLVCSKKLHMCQVVQVCRIQRLETNPTELKLSISTPYFMNCMLTSLLDFSVIVTLSNDKALLSPKLYSVLI